jgi:hypothetical protein
MKRSLKKRKYIRHYVLGTHDPRHQQQFEERLLTDEKLLEELSIVENELLYDYLSGSLSQSERERFEKGFLATADGERDLQFFRALKNHVDSSAPAGDSILLPRSWKRFLPAFLRGDNIFFKLSFVTVILILVFAGLFAFFQNQRNQGVTVFTATLGPGATRMIGGKEITVVEIPSDIDIVVLHLPSGEQNARRYRASLYTDKGEEKFTQDGLQSESTLTGRIVPLRVPANILAPGDFRVKVKAPMTGVELEDVASYSFRVHRLYR